MSLDLVDSLEPPELAEESIARLARPHRWQLEAAEADELARMDQAASLVNEALRAESPGATATTVDQSDPMGSHRFRFGQQMGAGLESSWLMVLFAAPTIVVLLVWLLGLLRRRRQQMEAVGATRWRPTRYLGDALSFQRFESHTTTTTSSVALKSNKPTTPMTSEMIRDYDINHDSQEHPYDKAVSRVAASLDGLASQTGSYMTTLSYQEMLSCLVAFTLGVLNVVRMRNLFCCNLIMFLIISSKLLSLLTLFAFASLKLIKLASLTILTVALKRPKKVSKRPRPQTNTATATINQSCHPTRASPTSSASSSSSSSCFHQDISSSAHTIVATHSAMTQPSKPQAISHQYQRNDKNKNYPQHQPTASNGIASSSSVRNSADVSTATSSSTNSISSHSSACSSSNVSEPNTTICRLIAKETPSRGASKAATPMPAVSNMNANANSNANASKTRATDTEQLVKRASAGGQQQAFVSTFGMLGLISASCFLAMMCLYMRLMMGPSSNSLVLLSQMHNSNSQNHNKSTTTTTDDVIVSTSTTEPSYSPIVLESGANSTSGNKRNNLQSLMGAPNHGKMVLKQLFDHYELQQFYSILLDTHIQTTRFTCTLSSANYAPFARSLSLTIYALITSLILLLGMIVGAWGRRKSRQLETLISLATACSAPTPSHLNNRRYHLNNNHNFEGAVGGRKLASSSSNRKYADLLKHNMRRHQSMLDLGSPKAARSSQHHHQHQHRPHHEHRAEALRASDRKWIHPMAASSMSSVQAAAVAPTKGSNLVGPHQLAWLPFTSAGTVASLSNIRSPELGAPTGSGNKSRLSAIGEHYLVECADTTTTAAATGELGRRPQKHPADNRRPRYVGTNQDRSLTNNTIEDTDTQQQQSHHDQDQDGKTIERRAELAYRLRLCQGQLNEDLELTSKLLWFGQLLNHAPILVMLAIASLASEGFLTEWTSGHDNAFVWLTLFEAISLPVVLCCVDSRLADCFRRSLKPGGSSSSKAALSAHLSHSSSYLDISSRSNRHHQHQLDSNNWLGKSSPDSNIVEQLANQSLRANFRLTSRAPVGNRLGFVGSSELMASRRARYCELMDRKPPKGERKAASRGLIMSLLTGRLPHFGKARRNKHRAAGVRYPPSSGTAGALYRKRQQAASLGNLYLYSSGSSLRQTSEHLTNTDSTCASGIMVHPARSSLTSGDAIGIGAGSSAGDSARRISPSSSLSTLIRKFNHENYTNVCKLFLDEQARLGINGAALNGANVAQIASSGYDIGQSQRDSSGQQPADNTLTTTTTTTTTNDDQCTLIPKRNAQVEQLTNTGNSGDLLDLEGVFRRKGGIYYNYQLNGAEGDMVGGSDTCQQSAACVESARINPLVMHPGSNGVLKPSEVHLSETPSSKPNNKEVSALPAQPKDLDASSTFGNVSSVQELLTMMSLDPKIAEDTNTMRPSKGGASHRSPNYDTLENYDSLRSMDDALSLVSVSSEFEYHNIRVDQHQVHKPNNSQPPTRPEVSNSNQNDVIQGCDTNTTATTTTRISTTPTTTTTSQSHTQNKVHETTGAARDTRVPSFLPSEPSAVEKEAQSRAQRQAAPSRRPQEQSSLLNMTQAKFGSALNMATKPLNQPQPLESQPKRSLVPIKTTTSATNQKQYTNSSSNHSNTSNSSTITKHRASSSATPKQWSPQNERLIKVSQQQYQPQQQLVGSSQQSSLPIAGNGNVRARIRKFQDYQEQVTSQTSSAVASASASSKQQPQSKLPKLSASASGLASSQVRQQSRLAMPSHYKQQYTNNMR